MNSNEYTIEGGTDAERNKIAAQIASGEVKLSHFTDGTGVPRVIGNCCVTAAKLSTEERDRRLTALGDMRGLRTISSDGRDITL